VIAKGDELRNGKRGRYTLEFKQEAVRLVESGQSIAEAAGSLGVVEQTLSNWVKLNRAGKLKEISGKAGVTAEQMEIAHLRAELARVRWSATSWAAGVLLETVTAQTWVVKELECMRPW
jgi:transposase